MGFGVKRHQTFANTIGLEWVGVPVPGLGTEFQNRLVPGLMADYTCDPSGRHAFPSTFNGLPERAALAARAPAASPIGTALPVMR